jgi:hypothetical protein
MTLSVAQFIIDYPEFQAIPVPSLQSKLDYASEELGDVWTAYPLRRDRAQGLLAAHGLKLASLSASNVSGPTTSEKVGDLQRSYAQSAFADPALSSFGLTVYGQEFVRLRRMTVVAMDVISCP